MSRQPMLSPSRSKVLSKACGTVRNPSKKGSNVGNMWDARHTSRSPCRGLRTNHRGLVFSKQAADGRRGSMRYPEKSAIRPFHAVNKDIKEDLKLKRTHSNMNNQELRSILESAHKSCGELKEAICLLSSKIHFSVLDKTAVNNDGKLHSLRHSLEQLQRLVLSFMQIIHNDDTQTSFLQRSHQNAPNRLGGNILQIKAQIVSLRALADKIPSMLDMNTAKSVKTIVDMGMLEQILSWITEVEGNYQVLQPLRPATNSSTLRNPPFRQFSNRSDVRLRSCFEEQIKIEGGKDLLHAKSSRHAWNRYRMQVHRPPAIVVR
eukprot:542819-Hanusia_phi.AAC.1